MNFKDLQESWKTQPVKLIIDPYKLSEQKSRWQIHQRKMLIGNIIKSMACLVTIIGITWAYQSHKQEFGWPFKVSTVAINLLMFIFCAISWKSYAFKKENLETSSHHFINYQIRKLHWQRNIITKYLWVYTVLIWLALVMNILETTSLRTATYRCTVLAITTAYVFGVTWWIWIKKYKKSLSAYNGLIADLENMKEKLLEDENTYTIF